MNDFTDRRADTRTDANNVANIKIVFSSETPGLLGTNLPGSAVDVSASGLRLSLNKEVPINSNLDIWVTFKDDFKKFFLSSKVRWCRQVDDSATYQAGISLHERTDIKTDLSDWKKAHKN